MCGIFGAIGNYGNDKMRLLALLNMKRGKQSTGFYTKHFSEDNPGWILKDAEDAETVIQYKGFADMLGKGVFIGHTRQATHGAVNKDNAHPFICGKICGAHNGIISNLAEKNEKHKTKYEVDSQVIFHNLDLFGFKGLNYLQGYWGLAWHDLSKPNHLYLSAFDNKIGVIKTSKAIYYSSDAEHLKIAGIKGEEIELLEGWVYEITPDLKCEKIFKSKPKKRVTTTWERNTTKGVTKPAYSYYDYDNYGYNREYPYGKKLDDEYQWPNQEPPKNKILDAQGKILDSVLNKDTKLLENTEAIVLDVKDIYTEDLKYDYVDSREMPEKILINGAYVLTKTFLMACYREELCDECQRKLKVEGELMNHYYRADNGLRICLDCAAVYGLQCKEEITVIP